MKLNGSPMTLLRADASRRIDAHFAQIAHTNAHRDHAHKIKREVADSVITGGPVPDVFAQEAALRGLPPVELARTIIDKTNTSPDTIERRELRRQTAMLDIAGAPTPAAVNGVLKSLGLDPQE